MIEEEDSSPKKEREDPEDPEPGLDGMLSYGERKNLARFEASCNGKLIQEDLVEIVERADASFQTLLSRAKGESIGSDAFQWKGKAILAAEALAFLNGGCGLDLVTALVVITIVEEEGDTIDVELVQGPELLSNRVVTALFRNGELSDKAHRLLTDGIDNTYSGFSVGDVITNRESVVRGHLTATERLRQLRAARCRLVKPMLPPGVARAEVMKVDNNDESLRWRAVNDRRQGGWVEQRGVRKVATSWQSDGGSDDDDTCGLCC